MGYVYAYAPNAEDLDCTGLCGALTPIECEHEEIAGGMSMLTMTHPFDPAGKWRHLKRGNIIKADVRVRTTPEIAGGQVVTYVEQWTVRDTATQAQRYVYSKATKGKKKKLLKPGTTVIVVQKGESRYKIKSGKVSGWIAHEALSFDLADTLPGTTDAIETVAPPWVIRSQLFEILEIETDTENNTITVYAPHISQSLKDNNTRYKNDEPLTAQEALDGIADNMDFENEFEFYTDIGDTRTSCDWTNVNPVQALLDLDEGFAPRWGAELVRDDYELYFLRRAGRDRGTRLEYGGELLGVNYRSSNEGVITAIKPTGVKKDGSLLYLTDDDDSPNNYIFSPYVNDYTRPRAYVLACDDCTVDKGKKQVTVEIARQRMREQTQRKFDEDQCDRPGTSLTVNFVLLGNTVEYEKYKGLKPIFLYDDVAIIDKPHGIEVQTKVKRIVWDCLHERVIEIELGDVREGAASIYSWQIPSLSGSKLLPGTVPGEALEDGTVPEEKLDFDFTEGIRLAKEQLERARDRIENTREWLNTVEGALRDTDGNVAALQITASEIRAGLWDAEDNIASLILQADQLSLDMEDAQENISTLERTATYTLDTLSDHAGSINSLFRDVNQLLSTIYDANTGLASQIQQLADRVAIRLHNPLVNSTFEAIIGNPSVGVQGSGLEFRYTDDPYQSRGTICAFKPQGIHTGGGLSIYGDVDLDLHAAADVYIATGGNNPEEIILNRQDRKIYATHALTVTSDARLKTDITDIDHGEELFDAIMPRQYRMIANGPDGRLQYGCIAQNVKAALEALGVQNTELLSEPADSEKMMGLSYEQFIALTMHKVKKMEARHQSQIEAFEARLVALERRDRHAET